MGSNHSHINPNEKKVKIVVVIATLAMITEIIGGYLTNSMALLADGWHMMAHVLVMAIAWFAYVFARKNKDNPHFSKGTERIYPLAGYTSAMFLMMASIMMISESVERVIEPENIFFEKAIMVAFIGLIVNGISVVLLYNKKDYRDHNIQAAYLHVLADVITSIGAILALIIGKFTQWYWLDSVSGIISALVILNWSIKLILNSGKTLIDYSLVEDKK